MVFVVFFHHDCFFFFHHLFLLCLVSVAFVQRVLDLLLSYCFFLHSYSVMFGASSFSRVVLLFSYAFSIAIDLVVIYLYLSDVLLQFDLKNHYVDVPPVQGWLLRNVDSINPNCAVHSLGAEPLTHHCDLSQRPTLLLIQTDLPTMLLVVVVYLHEPMKLRKSLVN